MGKRKSGNDNLMRRAPTGKPIPEYVSVKVVMRALCLSRTLVRRYFASRQLKGFKVGLQRNAAIKIARSSIVEFAKKHQGRVMTQAEIEQWLQD